LRTAADAAALLVQLEKCKLYSVLYAKNAANAATIITLLTNSSTPLTNDANAISTQGTERAKIVAYANSVTYTANSDSVSTGIIDTWRKMWFMKNWGSTNYTNAINNFSSIAGLSRTVEKGYGTTLQSEFDALYTGNYVESKKIEIQTKQYWYKQTVIAQMFEMINKSQASGGLKANAYAADNTLNTAKALLDAIFDDLYTKSKTYEITAVMILYYAVSICDQNNTNIDKALVGTAIT
jgi:hypothetical protein